MLLKDSIVSIVVPMHNEAQRIGSFIETLFQIIPSLVENYELILVDDGSKDQTVKVTTSCAAQNMNVRIIVLSRHYGLEIAVTAGLEQSIGDYVLLLNSQVKDFPDLIPLLLEKILEDDVDVVYAADVERQGQSWSRKYSAHLFYQLASHLTGLDIPNNSSFYRVLNRQAVNAITSLKEHNRYLKMLYGYVGCRISSVNFSLPPHSMAYGQLSWLESIEASLDAVLSFSTLPLRYMSLLAIMFSALLLLLAGYVSLDKLLNHEQIASGWTSLVFVLSLLFSILFFFLALLSEYISRILIETKNRPLYYIRQEIGGTQFKIGNIVNKV